MFRTAALLLGLTLTLTACSGASAGGSAAPRRNGNAISVQELEEPSISTLSVYDAIMRLRPTWLRERGATSVRGTSLLPEVILNESPSSVDMLRGLRASDVTALEYMNAADATTLYGTGYANGVIKVRTGGMR